MRTRAFLGIDVRALAVVRIALGLLVLQDLVARAFDLVAHYTDAGVLPRASIPAGGAGPFELYDAGSWSLYSLSGSAWYAALLFLGTAFFAVLLVVGQRTRWATVACWILLVALHARNPVLLTHGDLILRLLLFWGIFLPLGACWSVDARGQAPPPQTVLSVATFAVLAQVLLIYYFTARAKWHPIWRHDGDAVYYFLNLDMLVTRFGVWLKQFPALVKALGHGAWWIERYGPLLFLVPVAVPYVRTAAVALFAGFHIAIALTMDLGNFSWVCVTAWLLFLPPPVWDKVARLVRPLRLPLKPHPSAWRLPRGVQVFVGLCFLYTVVANLEAHAGLRGVPRAVHRVGDALGIRQSWPMFAPYPSHQDGWFVVPAKLADGRELDLATGRAVDWEMPVFDESRFRWRAYRRHLWTHHWRLIPDYARWLRRHHDVSSLEVHLAREFTEPDYQPPTHERQLLYEWRAGEERLTKPLPDWKHPAPPPGG